MVYPKHGNTYLEIRKIKKSIFKFGKDPDIVTHKYEGGLTIRAMVTCDGAPSVLGWKLIRLALMGKSWRYMARVTGIRKENISHLFHNHPIIRAAVLEMEKQIVEDSKALLLHSLRQTTVNLIKIATGKAQGPADVQKVQLSAITELYNRIGFAMPTRGGGGVSGNVVIRLESGEAKDLALLVRHRQDRNLIEAPDPDEEGGEEADYTEIKVGDSGDAGREEERGSVEDESVADNGTGDNEN